MCDLRPMELRDTVDMMNSEEYKERFKAEYYQTNLNFNPTCPRSTYNMQIRTMTDYIAVLEARAVMEGVDLEV